MYVSHTALHVLQFFIRLTNLLQLCVCCVDGDSDGDDDSDDDSDNDAHLPTT
jgi:hypothetical protein